MQLCLKVVMQMLPCISNTIMLMAKMQHTLKQLGTNIVEMQQFKKQTENNSLTHKYLLISCEV